ncbi:hypothetical protein [Allomuricauda sp.]|uniref:hypothetical protein n=1 Tax=Flagellimonas alginolytica TaxID=3177515 RepID=UPI0025FB33A2|nr:hypothetical protein [Allomuricauda sp.]
MLKKILNKIVAFFFVISVMGQNVQDSSQYSGLVQGIGVEGIYIHYNTNLLFTGEYLHFKLYALNKKSQSLSMASKVAYVELLNGQGERELIQKVKLIDGMGQGDVFIPTSLNSGYYTLVAYTNYMKNWPSDTFYADDIVVVNPYTNDQKVFWGTTVSEKGQYIEQKNNYKEQILNSELTLALDKKVYGKRDKVSLKIETKPNNYGIYSVSVRRIDKELYFDRRYDPKDYLRNFTSVDFTPSEYKYLPELRGELVSGSVMGDNGLAMPNTKFVFSLPGSQYEFRFARTDSFGKFRFSLNSENLDTKSIFQVWGGQQGKYSVEVAPIPDLELKRKAPKQFVLEKSMKSLIEERSTYNQIENAYFNSKPDTVLLKNDFVPIYGNDFTEYKLDEYTRFPTFKETLVEIVDNAWIATNIEGEESIFVRDFQATNMNAGYAPLVIVDGIVLQDHTDLIGYDINMVESIVLARNQFVVGGQIFQGIFDVKTFDEDFAMSYQQTDLKNIELIRPQAQKKYFRQDYSVQSFETIPDFRQQLLWEPNMELSKPASTIHFFTSDSVGEFEIVIEGFTKGMQPIKAVQYFTVE